MTRRGVLPVLAAMLEVLVGGFHRANDAVYGLPEIDKVAIARSPNRR